MKNNKSIPLFKNEDEERLFWETHDSTEYLDWSKAKSVVFPNVKPSTKTISLRLPESLLNEAKIVAHKKDIPYQSYIKILVSDGLLQERKRQSLGKKQKI